MRTSAKLIMSSAMDAALRAASSGEQRSGQPATAMKQSPMVSTCNVARGQQELWGRTCLFVLSSPVENRPVEVGPGAAALLPSP